MCLSFVDCRVGAPTTAKLSPPQHSADDGPPREMSTYVLIKTVFHMCSDPGEEAIEAINDGGEDWLFYGHY